MVVLGQLNAVCLPSRRYVVMRFVTDCTMYCHSWLAITSSAIEYTIQVKQRNRKVTIIRPVYNDMSKEPALL